MRNFYVIPLRTIVPPKTSPFPQLVDQIVDSVVVATGRRNKPSLGTLAKWRLAATLLLDGLYQAHHSVNQPRFLGVPLHRSAYGPTPGRVNLIGFEVSVAVLRTAESLGLVSICKGIWRAEDDCEMSTILPTQALVSHFDALGEVWLRREPPKDVLFLRNKPAKTTQDRLFGETARIRDRAFDIGVPKSDKARRMASAVRRINKGLASRRVALCIRNEEFRVLAMKMLTKRQKRRFQDRESDENRGLVNLSNIYLRRIFSHSSMRKGGRLYGCFVQFVPKEYRVHVTIDELPTIEVDYAALHPTMAYHLEGLDPPMTDCYDIGLWDSEERRELVRPIVKAFFNAMLNDEDSEAVLSRRELKILGISTPELRRRIAAAHPAISHYFGTDIGLRLQYEDSCLAEKVLLMLLDQGISCVPIHDSFVVQIIHADALRRAMLEAYEERFGKTIRLGERHLYQVNAKEERLFTPQFVAPLQEPTHPDSKFQEIDRAALFKLFADSRYSRYVTRS